MLFRAAFYLLLVVLIAKFAFEGYLYKRATERVLLATFRNQAIESCAHTGATGPMELPYEVWNHVSYVVVQIGKQEVDVRFWDVRNRLWEARYQKAYLRVTVQKWRRHIFCIYDIERGVASVHEL